MPPSRGLPPVVYCRGTRPIQAASSRPSGTGDHRRQLATSAVAMTGPTPGSLASRRQAASSRQIARHASRPACRGAVDVTSWSRSSAKSRPGKFRQARPRRSPPGPAGGKAPGPCGSTMPYSASSPRAVVDQRGALHDQPLAHAMQAIAGPAGQSTSPARSASSGAWPLRKSPRRRPRRSWSPSQKASRIAG